MIKINLPPLDWKFFALLLTIVGIIVFKPILFEAKTIFPANLLVSFYNPWVQEKYKDWGTGKVSNKPTGIDNLRLYYPYLSLNREQLLKGQIPFWNPYNFSGNYHLGQSESAVFYPIFLISYLFPDLFSWNFLLIIQPFLAATGMYLFLTLLFKQRLPAFLGAMVFGFSGAVITRMTDGVSVGHTLLWLPFIFYGIEGYLQKNKFRYLGIVLFSLSACILAGWFQFVFYIFSLSFFYALFRIIDNKNRINLRFYIFLPFILAPLLTLYQIFPAIQALMDSPRGIRLEPLGYHLMPFQHLLTFISPDFWGNPATYTFFGRSEYKESILYIGVIPFILAFFSLGLFKKVRIIRFFLFFSILPLILGINSPLSQFLIRLPLPIISSFLPDRIFLISSFCLTILSAFGLNFILINYKNIIKKTIFFFVIVPLLLIFIADLYILAIYISKYIVENIDHYTIQNSREYKIFFEEALAFLKNLSGIYIFPEQFLVQARNLVIPNIMIIMIIASLFLVKRTGVYFFILMSLGLAIFGQIYFAQKYIGFSDPGFIFPKHPVFEYLEKNAGINRFITVGNGRILPNLTRPFGLYSPDGLSAMYPLNYAKLFRYVDTRGKSTNDFSRVQVLFSPAPKPLFQMLDGYVLRFMQITGIKYVVKLRNEEENYAERYQTFGTENLPLVWQNDKWQIFAYKDVLPRFFWTNKYEVIKDKNNILKELFNSNAIKFPSKIFLEKNPDLSIENNSFGNAELLSYEPNSAKFKISGSGNGLLYLSDNYSSSFNILLDGKNANLLRANFSYRAVAVPSGDHTVVIYYNGTPVFFGLISAVLLLVISSIGIVYYKRKGIIYL